MQWRQGKKFFMSLYQPLVDLLVRWRVPPDAITVVGTLLLLIPSYLIIEDRLVLAGFLLWPIGLFDMVDGVVARRRKIISKRGNFLDSTLDRFGEFFVVLALFHYALQRDDRLLAYLIVISLFFNLTFSYARAKAESLGIKTTAGFLTRPARGVIISWGLIFRSLHITFWILVVFGAGSALYRIVDVLRKVRRR